MIIIIIYWLIPCTNLLWSLRSAAAARAGCWCARAKTWLRRQDQVVWRRGRWSKRSNGCLESLELARMPMDGLRFDLFSLWWFKIRSMYPLVIYYPLVSNRKLYKVTLVIYLPSGNLTGNYGKIHHAINSFNGKTQWQTVELPEGVCNVIWMFPKIGTQIIHW